MTPLILGVLGILVFGALSRIGNELEAIRRMNARWYAEAEPKDENEGQA